jgi:hypothetical protein
VAHYLIQSRRTQTNLEDSGNETLASPVASQLSELDTDKSPDGFSKPQPEDYIFDNMEEKVKDELQFLVGKKHVDDNCDKDDAIEKTDEMKKKPQPEDYIFDNMEEKVKDELQFLVGKKHVDDNCDKDDAVEKTDEMKKKQEDICEPCVEA